MDKIAVVWEGSILDNHSLSNVNRYLCDYLSRKSDLELFIVPKDSNPVYHKWSSKFNHLISRFNLSAKHNEFHIAQQWPPQFIAPQKGKWILFQPWEYSSVPKAWIPFLLYEIDEIWVNSQFTKQAYVRSGIPDDKIFVFPLGIDPSQYRIDGSRLNLPTKKSFKFLFVGGTIWRKGIDVLLRAYVNTFSANDDVTLIIKDFGTSSFYKGQTAKHMIDEISNNPNAPEIIYLDNELTPEEMAALYRTCNSLVHPFRGEGFGLPILEAMACGLPVIIPDKGSAIDFTTAQNTLRVSSEYEKINQNIFSDLELVYPMEYIQVDEAELSKTMKFAHQNPQKLILMGKNAAQEVAQNYPWEIVSEKVYSHLVDNLGKTSIRSQAFDVIDEATKQQENGNWTVSLWLWHKVINQDSHNQLALLNIGRITALLNRYGEAIHYLEKVDTTNLSNDLIQEVYYLRALNYASLKQFIRANECMKIMDRGYETAKLLELQKYINENIEYIKMYANIDTPASVIEWKEVLYRNMRLGLHEQTVQYWIKNVDKQANILYVGENGDMLASKLSLDNHMTVSRSLTMMECSVNTTQTYNVIIFDRVIEYVERDTFMDAVFYCKKFLSPNGALIIHAFDVSDVDKLNYTINEHLIIHPYSYIMLNKILSIIGLHHTEQHSSVDGETVTFFFKYNPIEILWESPIYDQQDFAIDGKSLVKGALNYSLLFDIGHTVPSQQMIQNAPEMIWLSANVARYPEVHFQGKPINEIIPPKAPISIGRTAIGYDLVPDDWLNLCHQLSEIWIPNEFSRLVFINSGFSQEKLFVLPEAVDFEFYHPIVGYSNFRSMITKNDDFVFLSKFDWNYGSGWDVLIKAYIQTFSKYDPVMLVIYTAQDEHTNPRHELENFIKNSGYRIEDIPNIQLITSSLNDMQVRDLYQSVDAFVLPARATFLSTSLIIALSMRLPVITTNWGGHLSFLNEKNGYLIQIDGLEEVKHLKQRWDKTVNWAVPNIESTMNQMRIAFENRKVDTVRQNINRESLMIEHSIHNVAMMMNNRINILLMNYR